MIVSLKFETKSLILSFRKLSFGKLYVIIAVAISAIAMSAVNDDFISLLMLPLLFVCVILPIVSYFLTFLETKSIFQKTTSSYNLNQQIDLMFGVSLFSYLLCILTVIPTIFLPLSPILGPTIAIFTFCAFFSYIVYAIYKLQFLV